MSTFRIVGTSLQRHATGHTSRTFLIPVPQFWSHQGVRLTGHREELTGLLVPTTGAARVVTGCHDHLHSPTGDTGHRSSAVSGSIVPTDSWWLYWHLVLLAVMVGQPGSFSRLGPASGLRLLLVLD